MIKLLGQKYKKLSDWCNKKGYIRKEVFKYQIIRFLVCAYFSMAISGLLFSRISYIVQAVYFLMLYFITIYRSYEVVKPIKKNKKNKKLHFPLYKR